MIFPVIDKNDFTFAKVFVFDDELHLMMKFSVPQRTPGRRMVTKSMHKEGGMSKGGWPLEAPMPEQLRRVRNMMLQRGKTALW